MSIFMHKYIERIVNIEGDDNYGYRAVSALLGKGEDNHTLSAINFHDFRTHKKSYTRLYKKKENFDAIYESLIPCFSGPTPEVKWMRFPKIGHLIACAYDIMCIDLTRYSFSKTFFPPHTALPQNPNDLIMCIGLPSKSRHFVQVLLKSEFPIPLTEGEE
ncbi:uncharacterized protein LOC127136332 [Lathyrus oleraceus]|uniref:uncharacterized protein LOC127136332 n=1 Tax=Pisum sativum TaxID=3888 RepID=UPI0021D350E4|nr:uncharacterized protein LOC127136332 [Pisum sativum]